MKSKNLLFTHTQRILQIFLGIAVVSVFLWACEKDRLGSLWFSSNEFKEYQIWFENQYSEILPLSLFDTQVAPPGSPNVLVKPVWSHSILHVEDPTYDFLEVPLETNGILTLDRSGKHAQIGLTRMLIRKNRLSGQKGAYFITLLCDEKFIEDQPHAYLSSSLRNLPDDFSGSILIHTLNGAFKGGRMVEKGRQITGKILTDYELSRSDIIHTRSPCIYTVRVQIYYQNQYLLSLEGEVGGQPVVFGPKVIDDGITVETGEFTVDNCDQDTDDDIDPQDPWTWVSNNISSPSPTPNPCDGHNIVDGPIEIAPTRTWTDETSGIYGCVRAEAGENCNTCGGNKPNYNKCHHGFDIKADVGSNVYSMHHGKVVFSGYINGYGKNVRIESEVNGQTIYLYYAHLDSYSVYFGDLISAGSLIGKSGTSGNAGNIPYPHVHLGRTDVTGNGKLDPYPYGNFWYNVLPSGDVSITNCY